MTKPTIHSTAPRKQTKTVCLGKTRVRVVVQHGKPDRIEVTTPIESTLSLTATKGSVQEKEECSVAFFDLPQQIRKQLSDMIDKVE